MNGTKFAKLSLLFTVICLVGFGSLFMKNKVQELEQELVSINKSIHTDIKTIHVLKAEWSHLNNPSRLRKLAAKHISLNKLKAEQIINYSALPFEYESDESRRLIAMKNISDHANKNKMLKRLVKAERN